MSASRAVFDNCQSAGLAVKSLSVGSVYLGGRLLSEGLGDDYHMETIAHDKIMRLTSGQNTSMSLFD